MGRHVIIAEIGQNYCGDIELAKTLIGLAKLFNADLVKFQLFDKKVIKWGLVEMTFDQAHDLFEYGKQIDMEIFFSVFDIERIKWCEEIGVRRYKIAYSQRNNRAILNAVKAIGKPIIISSNKPMLFDTLYCIPEYPTNEVDFNHLEDFAGFSDHTIGLEAAKEAIRLGARIIEKHFAINHETGVDAEWSMTPKELKELVRFARCG